MNSEDEHVIEFTSENSELISQQAEKISLIKWVIGLILQPAGPGLLGQIVIDKYIDHLPLHRQMQRFERNGVKLPYSTLTDWVSSTCKLITPLYEALRKEVMQSGYLHVDETPIKVLDKDKKGQTHKGYYLVYQNSIDKIVLFNRQEGRGREGPMMMLENFQGYLQTDGSFYILIFF